ncbi:MAG: flagellar biosynthesis anti-sigma factor FlgM [Janthinobacterium lividum]
MKLEAYGSALPESTQSLTTGVIENARSSSLEQTASQAAAEDTTSFASGTASVQALTEAAFNTTSRAARVASLQQAVRSGQYTVDLTNVATAFAKTDI